MNRKIIFTLFLSIGFILYGLVSVTADTVENPSGNEITITNTCTPACTPACTPTYTPTYTPTPSSDINNNLSAKSEVIVGPWTSTTEHKPQADCTQNDLIEMSNSGMSFDEMSEFLEICYQKAKNASDIIAEVKNQGKRLNIQELKIALEKYPDQESEVMKRNRERYEQRRAERLTSKTPTPSVTPTETTTPTTPTTPTPDTTSTPLPTDNTGLPSKAPFNDVKTTDWHYEAVSFISSKSIAKGTPDGNFHPNSNLTRGECIVMLMKAYNISPDTNPSDNFSDAGDTYYTNYLSSAKKLGITNGVGNNKFEPNKAISRQEVVVFIYNALKVLDKLPEESNVSSLSNYKDSNDISIWANTAMDRFTKCAIIAGVGDKLLPKSITTRAQMAQILFNILSQK